MTDIVASYELVSPDPERAARALAVGQSIGNPDVRNAWEHEAMWARHGAEVVILDQHSENSATVVVSFPSANMAPKDGWAFLLSVLMGGQMDIDIIESCRLVDLVLPVGWGLGPAYGLPGIRDITHAFNRPLIGGIIKPKLGLTPGQLADICWQMADGGVDFIKEDEVLGSAEDYAPLGKRVEAVARALRGYSVLYAPCVTADPGRLLGRARVARAAGATALHLNWWCGLGAYALLRERIGLPLFFQKSGDRIITTGHYSLGFEVLCFLARRVGVDFIHIGMLGGYLDEDADAIRARLRILQDGTDFLPVLPSLSCGLYPGLVDFIRGEVGDDVMLSAGGSIHGHPSGTCAGARAFADAVRFPPGERGGEYRAAVGLWGEK